ncbi:hypothetical protein [Tardiphaga sp.]|uniref:hypothetical protein n=1 Tax=Tardiphaga sp. TaxID=1926292 RepID=UPI00261D6CD4|nr:hypothetical protein [Tardiphaga sp.]MDB5620512.1 hypothetical protein [Tardiphaga sp.]
MVDLTITATNVLAGGNATTETGKAGVAITAGQVVYKEAATGTFKLADCDSATAEVKVPYGIALNGAGVGQPVVVATGGDVTLGAVLTAGLPVYLSETPGGMRLTPDTGDYVAMLGIAKTTSILAIRIIIPGVTL